MIRITTPWLLATVFLACAAFPAQVQARTRIDPPYWAHDPCSSLADASAVPQCAAYSEAKLEALNRILAVMRDSFAGRLDAQEAGNQAEAAMQPAGESLKGLDQALQSLLASLDDPSDLTLDLDGEAEYLDAAREYWRFAARMTSARAEQAQAMEQEARSTDQWLSALAVRIEAIVRTYQASLAALDGGVSGAELDAARQALALAGQDLRDMAQTAAQREQYLESLIAPSPPGSFWNPEGSLAAELRSNMSRDWLLPEEHLAPDLAALDARLAQNCAELEERLERMAKGLPWKDLGEPFAGRSLDGAVQELDRVLDMLDDAS